MTATLIARLFAGEEIVQAAKQSEQFGFKPILHILQGNLTHDDPVVRSTSVTTITDLVTTWLPTLGEESLGVLISTINTQSEAEEDERAKRVFRESIRRIENAAHEFVQACEREEQRRKA